jgi:hypothetical protein
MQRIVLWVSLPGGVGKGLGVILGGKYVFKSDLNDEK